VSGQTWSAIIWPLLQNITFIIYTLAYILQANEHKTNTNTATVFNAAWSTKGGRVVTPLTRDQKYKYITHMLNKTRKTED